MNKNIIITILATTLVTLMIMAIIGMSMEDETEQTYETIPTQSEAKEAFVSSCRAENPPEGFCTCAWDKLSDMYTVREIAEMGNSDVFPSEFYDIRDQCLMGVNAQQI